MNKAAVGIHNYEEALAFIEVGASALGASTGIAIVEGTPTDESREQTYWTRAIELNDCTPFMLGTILLFTRCKQRRGGHSV